MQTAVRRPMLALATLTTAGTLALTPITVTPNAPTISAARISTQAVQLTDAWSDLGAHTIDSVVELATTFLGVNNNYPLPPGSFPLAPVATQLVLNQIAYLAQLFNGQGGQIPGEISTHLTEVFTFAGQVLSATPDVIGEQLKTPFVALQQALATIGAAPNPLAGLLYAPAIFLDIALNSPAGLLGAVGPIGFSLIIRNVLTTVIYTPIPTITLPFKKPAAATPEAAATTAPAPTAPSGTASSARSKSAAPVTGSRKASAKAGKAPSAKASTKSGAGAGQGQGHSKRG